jgi:hypothetical protein
LEQLLATNSQWNERTRPPHNSIYAR